MTPPSWSSSPCSCMGAFVALLRHRPPHVLRGCVQDLVYRPSLRRFTFLFPYGSHPRHNAISGMSFMSAPAWSSACVTTCSGASRPRRWATIVYRGPRPHRARLRGQEGQEDRDQPQVLSRLHHRQHVPARREQQARGQDLVLRQGDRRRPQFRRRQGPSHPDAAEGSRGHAAPRSASAKTASSRRLPFHVGDTVARGRRSLRKPDRHRRGNRSGPRRAARVASTSSAAPRRSISNTGRSRRPSSIPQRHYLTISIT